MSHVERRIIMLLCNVFPRCACIMFRVERRIIMCVQRGNIRVNYLYICIVSLHYVSRGTKNHNVTVQCISALCVHYVSRGTKNNNVRAAWKRQGGVTYIFALYPDIMYRVERRIIMLQYNVFPRCACIMYRVERRIIMCVQRGNVREELLIYLHCIRTLCIAWNEES